MAKKKTTKKKTAKKKTVKKKAVTKKPPANKTKQTQEITVPKKGLTQHQTYLLAVFVIVVLAGLLWYGFTTPVTPPTTIPPSMVTATPIPITAATELIIIKDATCDICNSDNVADIMQLAFNGVTINEIDSQSEQGQTLISSLELKALPAYVFNTEVENETNFTEMGQTMVKKDEYYVVDERVRGLIVRYLESPSTENEPATHESAPVTIIEFSDPACGACKVFNLETKTMLENTYGNNVRIVFKSMPLSPTTLNASIAMECANEQGKFWEYNHAIYSNGIQDLNGLALNLSLDMTQFNNCTSTNKYFDEVMGDQAEGIDYGVLGTPTLFINGIKITGVPLAENFQKIIDAELA